MVTTEDSTLENEEVVAAIAKGIVLPRDQEHLEGLSDNEAVALALSLNVRVSATLS